MKKPSVISFLITLLLAAAVCIHGGQPVKDTAGNYLETDQQYFIQPANTDGGGLVPAPPTLFPFCPLGIVQTLLTSQPGLPVSFSTPNANIKTTVSTDDYVNVEFKSNNWFFCNEFSKVWKFSEISSATKEPPILVGGTPQEPNSWFKIEIAGEEEEANTYKLTTSTGTIGAIPGIWFNASQLVLTNDNAKTLLVKFVTTATTSTKVEKLGLSL
ncbi:unnamed protein product [Arabidopsis halleri]